MWMAHGLMIVIRIVMKRLSRIYLYGVETIASHALKNRADASDVDKFRNELKTRREPRNLVYHFNARWLDYFMDDHIQTVLKLGPWQLR